MGDMKPRPRGGWQVGSYRQKRGKNFGPYSDEHPDPSPDVFSVKRLPGDQFIVAHYPHVDAQAPCCRPVHVRTRAGEDEAATLHRADQMVQQQHAQRGRKAIA
jgi:hypothetical protein